jgi:hypothetical protein
VGESDAGRATLRFSSIRVGEGGRRWHATWWLGCPEEGEKARVGRCWAKMGRGDQAAAGSVLMKTKENGVDCSKDFGPN